MQPSVSVIIPIYKAEEYLPKFLHSLFGQSLSNVEYIFIDDCSPDRSIEVINNILDSYINRRSQVQIIHHKSNRGVSASRQDGLERVKGEYVIHCDPDDWIDNNFLEELYLTAKKENSDVVFCDFSYEKYGYSRRVCQKPTEYNSSRVLCELFVRLHGSTCNKLIKTSKIRQLKLAFDPNFNFCEDLLFNTKLFLHTLAISYTDKTQYHYRCCINSNSVVRNYNMSSFQLDKNLAKTILNLVKETSAKSYCRQNMAYLIAWRAFIGNCFTSKEYKENILPYLKDILSGNIQFLQKLLLISSSIGLYRLTYSLYTRLKKFKR